MGVMVEGERDEVRRVGCEKGRTEGGMWEKRVWNLEE